MIHAYMAVQVRDRDAARIRRCRVVTRFLCCINDSVGIRVFGLTLIGRFLRSHSSSERRCDIDRRIVSDSRGSGISCYGRRSERRANYARFHSACGSVYLAPLSAAFASASVKYRG